MPLTAHMVACSSARACLRPHVARPRAAWLQGLEAVAAGEELPASWGSVCLAILLQRAADKAAGACVHQKPCAPSHSLTLPPRGMPACCQRVTSQAARQDCVPVWPCVHVSVPWACPCWLGNHTPAPLACMMCSLFTCGV